MYVEKYLNVIGTETGTMVQHIDTDAVSHFAAAIGDMSPIYHDAEYAKATEYGGIIAPPTFAVSLRYPEVKGVWMPPMGMIHALQEFNYEKPLYAGRDYLTASKIKDVYERKGKNGTSLYIEQEQIVYDLDMQYCTSFTLTFIIRGNLFKEYYKEEAPAEVEEEKPAVEEKKFLGFDDLSVGMELEPVVLPPYDKLTIAKYAGVSHDFNAIHIDDDAAHKMRFKAALAHGLLSVALQTTVFNVWFGQPDGYKLKNLKSKFVNPAYVGDVPTAKASVTELDAETRTAKLSCTLSSDSGTIISGSVIISFPA